MVSVRVLGLKIIGGLQCVLGAMSSLFAYFVYASQQIREVLSISQREVSLFMLIFIIFGVFSIVSGAKLLNETS